MINRLTETKPEPEFTEQLKQFVPSLFEKTAFEPKMVNGQKMTCGELMQLFQVSFLQENDQHRKTYCRVFDQNTMISYSDLYDNLQR